MLSQTEWSGKASLKKDLNGQRSWPHEDLWERYSREIRQLVQTPQNELTCSESRKRNSVAEAVRKVEELREGGGWR